MPTLTPRRINALSFTMGALALFISIGGDALAAHAATPAGRCVQTELSVAGAKPGEVPFFTPLAPIPSGMLLQALAVPGPITLNVCNLTAAPSPAITNLPVRIGTIG